MINQTSKGSPYIYSLYIWHMDITIIFQPPLSLMAGFEFLRSGKEIDGFVLHLVFLSIELDWRSDENSGGMVIR